MSNASREAQRASLSSCGEGRAAKIDRLYSTLDSINSTDVRSHFHAIEMLDGKTPSILTSIQGRPAALVVNEMADTLMQMSTQAQATALQVCETESTNPGGRHLRRRAPAAARAKLSNQLKAIRMVSSS